MKPKVKAVISSATKDCPAAAVPRAAGNRSSMRSVSTGNANCAPMAAKNSSACCSGTGTSSTLACTMTRVIDTRNVTTSPRRTCSSWSSRRAKMVEMTAPVRMPQITGRNRM